MNANGASSGSVSPNTNSTPSFRLSSMSVFCCFVRERRERRREREREF